jgi:creatinine amidohydrolase
MPLWYELTQPEFLEVAERTSVAVMVTGSLEAHGNHLPLGTDTILPDYLGKQIAEKTNALVLPPIPFGDSWVYEPFRGTVTVSPITLTQLYSDVMDSVFNIGFRFLVIINGHGGNIGSLKQAAAIATSKKEASVILVNWWTDLAENARKSVLETPEGHAAEDETSEVMFVRPELVDMSQAVASKVKRKYSIISGAYREEIYPSAIMGDPRSASEEKGKAIMEEAIDDLVKLIEQLERGELPMEHI